jgi:hypothetical protein
MMLMRASLKKKGQLVGIICDVIYHEVKYTRKVISCCEAECDRLIGRFHNPACLKLSIGIMFDLTVLVCLIGWATYRNFCLLICDVCGVYFYHQEKYCNLP